MSPRLQIVTLLFTLGLALPAHGSLSPRQRDAFLLHHRAALRGLAAVNKVNELRAAASASKAASTSAASASKAASASAASASNAASASVPASTKPAPPKAPAAVPVAAPATPASPAKAPAVPVTAPATLASPAKEPALPSKDIWRQFVLDLLSAKIELHKDSQSAASLPAVTLTQKTLTRLLAEGRARDPQQTSSAWHRAAALQLRAAMEADRRLVLAQRRPAGKGPTSAMAEAVAEVTAAKQRLVPADTDVPPLTKAELSYIRELLEEAREGDVILPQ